MDLGRVIGTVVATQKAEGLHGVKLLVVEPLNHRREVIGPAFVAIDVCQAGPGEIVNWVASREAAMALPDAFVPVDAAIVGLVDRIDVEGERAGGMP
jgi:ethanolamine utilization protein EutN